MATQVDLLQHKVIHLESALRQERKRQHRGKPLPLLAPPEYHGSAVFWSPTKVQDARERIAHKEAEEEELKLQKHKKARARETAKVAKAELMERRAHIRMAAKEIRLQEQVAKKLLRQEKAAQREEEKHT